MQFCSAPRGKKDTTHKCAGCRHTTAVKTWKCPCNIPWYLCHEHVNTTTLQIESTPNAKAHTANKGHKRPMPSSYLMSYYNLLADDEMRAERKRARHNRALAKERWIQLGSKKRTFIPLTFLSPYLINRFKGGHSSPTTTSNEASARG